MAWLKQGLHDGALAVNSPSAFVHVVADGLLLSSPRIFREFADKQVAGTEPAVDVAKRVQCEVLRQGWHIRTEQGMNFLYYERKRSGGGSFPINGIVIREPQRFFRSLPAIDFELVRLADPTGKSA
jgi:hypothetical protein